LLAKLVKRALLEDAPLLALIGSFAVVTYLMNRLTGYPSTIHWAASRRLFIFSLFYAVGATFAVLIHVVTVQKLSLRRAKTWQHILATLFPPEATLNFLFVVTAFTVLMPAFLAFKQSIPDMNPFSWDLKFMEWDRLIHFGMHPFEWLQMVIGRPIITHIIDLVYFAWIHAMWMTVVWQSWHGSRATPFRSQFLLSFALCWIVLGTVLAVLLSSAGPVYFGDVTGLPSPYTPLLDYLNRVDMLYEIRALRIQEFLWIAYTDPGATILAGISAMPSLHVAIAVLMVLLAFRVNRVLGFMYAAFATLILVGSVHLAWHYAIDGYFSLIAVLLIWSAAGRITRCWRSCFLKAARDGKPVLQRASLSMDSTDWGERLAVSRRPPAESDTS
jgi:hypothetical protein